MEEAKMVLKASSFVFLALIVFFSSAISINAAIDITSSLSKHENFKVFNEYLTKTKLAQEINKQAAATVLALHDNTMSSITTKPVDQITKILSQQVIPEFYNVQKLKEMKKDKPLKTLYQGNPVGLNVVQNGNDISLGSAEKNASPPVKVLNTVFDEGTTLSVIHVAGPILSPSAEAPGASPSAAPNQAPGSAPTSSQEAGSHTPSSASEGAASHAAPESAPKKEGEHHGSGVSRITVGYSFGVAAIMALVLNVVGI